MPVPIGIKKDKELKVNKYKGKMNVRLAAKFTQNTL